MSRGCQKHSGNLFCTSCRIRLCTVLAWQFPHLKGRLELYTNWTTALSAEQPHLLKVCWLVRSSANSLYPYLPTNGCLTPAFNHCESSNTSVYPRCLHFRDIFSGWEMTSLFYFYANVCCEYSPCWSHSHNLSLFLWELMDASYIGSMPTMQNHAKILLQCLQRDLVICWFPAQKWEPVAGDMVHPFHPKKGATNRSIWQPSPSSCQNHFLLFKSKHVRGEIQTCVVSCR